MVEERAELRDLRKLTARELYAALCAAHLQHQELEARLSGRADQELLFRQGTADLRRQYEEADQHVIDCQREIKYRATQGPSLQWERDEDR